MADETQTQAAANNSAQAQDGPDPKFFDCVNEYLELTNKQSREYGEKRISLASMYAAARFNAHVYLVSVKPIHAASERTHFLDYMSTMYRRMLNEHLDAANAAFNVGYESPSQFSREYSRLFGVTPKRDINGLRRSAVK